MAGLLGLSLRTTCTIEHVSEMKEAANHSEGQSELRE